MSHRFGSTCALFLLSALPTTALAGESSDPGPVLVETILDKEVGGLDAGGHWLDARASEPVSYEGKESSSKQSGPGGGTTTLYGEFLNADLECVKNTYGVGFTGSGDGYPDRSHARALSEAPRQVSPPAAARSPPRRPARPPVRPRQ